MSRRHIFLLTAFSSSLDVIGIAEQVVPPFFSFALEFCRSQGESCGPRAGIFGLKDGALSLDEGRRTGRAFLFSWSW